MRKVLYAAVAVIALISVSCSKEEVSHYYGAISSVIDNSYLFLKTTDATPEAVVEGLMKQYKDTLATETLEDYKEINAFGLHVYENDSRGKRLLVYEQQKKAFLITYGIDTLKTYVNDTKTDSSDE